eukprot:s22_g41.t1
MHVVVLAFGSLDPLDISWRPQGPRALRAPHGQKQTEGGQCLAPARLVTKHGAGANRELRGAKEPCELREQEEPFALAETAEWLSFQVRLCSQEEAGEEGEGEGANRRARPPFDLRRSRGVSYAEVEEWWISYLHSGR